MVPRPDAPNNVEVSVDDSQGPSMKKAPKKIYIPIRIRTNALNNDDIAINATYISIEDLASAAKRQKSRDVEIRYLDSIKSFRDKIKSSYSCSQDHCPMIKERLDQHQIEHHRRDNTQSLSWHTLPRCCSRDRHSQTKLPTMNGSVSEGTQHQVASAEHRIKKSVAISPAASILKKTPTSKCMESQSMQTPSRSIGKCVDFNHTAQDSFDIIRSHDMQTQYSNSTQPRKVDEKTKMTSEKSFLREDLQEEIEKWFEDIPIYPSLTSSLKNLRRNMINDFIDKVYNLSNDVTAKDYNRKVKAEVENFLNALPMWYPGAKRDQDLLKEGIKNNLLDKIRSLSDNTPNKTRVKYVDDMVNTDVNLSLTNNGRINQIEQEDKEKIIESEVLDWLMQIKFKESDEIGKTINIIDATDIFTKRLLPLLDKPSSSKNYKLILKGLIVDTLNDLPNVLHYPKHKRYYFNRIAENLTNRLISVQAKHKTFFNCCFPKERSMYQMAVCSKSSLKQSIMDGLNNCLQSVRIEQRNDIKEEITDILIDCLESVRFKEDMEDKDELINNVLGNRFYEMSETQTSDTTIENVRDFLAEDIINNANKDLVRSCHSGTLSVFTSEHELPAKYPITSTPKEIQSVAQDTILNKEESRYLNSVGLLIRNWMETLPKKFDNEEEKSFKKVMINDLAGDLLDQLKLEQVAPITTPDRDKFMFYIVFRWLIRFEVYEDFNDATPQIENLVKKLHEVPAPILPKPQRGNYQATHNSQQMEAGYKLKNTDIFEDEIANWMNEQSPEIYAIKDRDSQNKMVQELAGTLKNKINDETSDKVLEEDLSKWMRIMLKSSEKNNIKKLSQSLKSRIMKLLKNGMTSRVSSSGSEISQAILPSNSDQNKDPVSNSWLSCKCPLETTDSKKESELSQDVEHSEDKYDEEKAKQLTPTVLGDLNISDSELSEDTKITRNLQKTNERKQSNHTSISHYTNSESGSQDKKNTENGLEDKQTEKITPSAVIGDSRLARSQDSKLKHVDKYKEVSQAHSDVSTSSKDTKTSASETAQESKLKIGNVENKYYRNSKSSESASFKDSNGTDKTNQRVLAAQTPLKRENNDKEHGTMKKPTKPPPKACLCAPSKTSPTTNTQSQIITPAESVDKDKTLTEYIGKYIERSDVDDNMTRGAYGEILKREFRKLDPPTRKEVYDNYTKDKLKDEFSPDRLSKELQYVKDISDWLKNIPIDGSFNIPQNRERIEFVNDLAMKIYEVEENRRNEPSVMDYNSQLASVITEYTEKLPILPNLFQNIPLMVDQLMGKVVASRTPMPCCANSNITGSSLNSTGIPEQNISEFIDNYIRLNAGEIANDPVKLDAWSARVLQEAKKIIRDSAEPSTLCKTQVYDKLANIAIPEEESIRLFGLELDYAKEISEWLSNLPLLPITAPETSELRVKMISELAEKFAEKEKHKLINPSKTESNQEMEEYVTKWIQQLPLHSNKEIIMPLVVQQLLNRIERVNKGQDKSIDQSTNTPKKVKSKVKSISNKTCRPSCCSSGGKAGQLVVEAIETWSNNLPVKAENKDAEKIIKDGVAKKLFQKVGDLSVDPEVMNNDMLYHDLLTEEVDEQLSSLPQSPEIQKKKENLKKSIVDKVMEAKSLAKESAAGETYKQQLESTIDASIPNPLYNRKVEDPGFEIYKNRLAEMFILENFDHGNDDIKLKYEKILKKEIDKYHQYAQMRNAIPLSKEEIYNELYGELFKVPMPFESSTAADVEEVKTRCEIADWFENLPLQKISGGDELLKRDKIQSMLAKRLKEIENKEQKPDSKIHKEITKWVTKLPLLPGNETNIDKFADTLLNKLKATKDDRKRVSFTNPPLNKTSKTKGILGTSQIAGPSKAGQIWTTPPSSQVCCQQRQIPRKKAAEVILEIVENWCDSLPFYENTQKSLEMNRVIRDDLGTKIIIKISELNSDPKTFSDDLLYNYLFDAELEKLMANLPICCDFKPTKDYKKEQLKEAIKSVKTLIREERSRHEYTKELNSTVSNVLKEPLNTTAEKITLFNELREDIVENFVQYHYDRDDDEGKQVYKAKLRDAVLKYFLEIQDKPDESGVDPLIKQNQLLCELAKISVPNERAMKDEVEEIRMKNEVRQFFEDQALNEGSEEKMATVNNIKISLAKRLNEIEKTGHNCANDTKMKTEISRYLKKLDTEVTSKEIEAFVGHLKATETARKSPPVSKDDSNCLCPKETSLNGNAINVSQPPIESDNGRTDLKLCCPQAYNDARSLGTTPVEYQGFGGGVALSSSPQQADTNGQSQPQDTANVCPNRFQTADGNQGEGSDGRFDANARRQKPLDTEEECKCLDGKRRRKMRGRPRCVLRRSEFCDDCGEYGPMWMPMSPYRFPPGYFYF